MDKRDQIDIELFLKYLQSVILKGRAIEVYSGDRPYPSILIAWIDDKPLHVVVSYDDVEDMCYIITAYVPNEKYFEKDLITRRIK